jgi:hypothetical protein
MITVAYGTKPDGLAKLVNLDVASATMQGASMLRDATGSVKQIIVGAIQRRGDSKMAMQLESGDELNPADGKEVWRQYASVIEPFLLRGISESGSEVRKYDLRSSPICSPQKTSEWFRLFRESCSPSATAVLTQLQSLCEQRHQFDTQRRAQAWLHGWIAFHAGVSILLGVLLITHIVLALRYL